MLHITSNNDVYQVNPRSSTYVMIWHHARCGLKGIVDVPQHYHDIGSKSPKIKLTQLWRDVLHTITYLLNDSAQYSKDNTGGMRSEQ